MKYFFSHLVSWVTRVGSRATPQTASEPPHNESIWREKLFCNVDRTDFDDSGQTDSRRPTAAAEVSESSSSQETITAKITTTKLSHKLCIHDKYTQWELQRVSVRMRVRFILLNTRVQCRVRVHLKGRMSLRVFGAICRGVWPYEPDPVPTQMNFTEQKWLFRLNPLTQS